MGSFLKPDTVWESSELMRTFGERSQQVGNIVSVIDEIAMQTNMLALTAAVEAARAGEQGTGEAVVANEVRNLAEKTTEAARKISEMIQALSTIVESADDLQSMVQQITSSIIEISAVSEHISGDIEIIASISKETFSDLAQLAMNLQDVVGQFTASLDHDGLEH
ncbi:MAG: hypothetical protein GY754_03865 [bacterium]|nr:hypothetical protein [bacterium]